MSSEPIWARPHPGQRRPAHSREKIAEAALRIADAEGFEAVSMRRVAAELGAGTMTLYHYVRTKDELTALMADAIMGELLVPDDEVPAGWREGMAEIARRTNAIFVRHPWIVEHLDDDENEGPGGPNALRHVEQSLAVASRSGLDVDEQFELVALVDDYVFGHAIRARELGQAEGRTGAEQRLDAVVGYLETQLQTGEFPHLEAIAGDDPRAGFERIMGLAADEGRFERGLQRLLDGIELWLARRGV
jgi:AcrR family transcriptional regulator